jgi:hypothetical protein
MLKTFINWTLNNYCKANCYYCPSTVWGGEEPRNIEHYLNFVEKANRHFDQLGRTIDWKFDGGEPLDMFDLPQLLKLCKRDNNIIELTTNGGRMWIDWWALEPNVDVLNLSYHYWQNPSLIKYVVELFVQKNKKITVIVPMRHTHFEEDYTKAMELQHTYNIAVNKILLIQNLDWIKGYYPYTEEQIILINGKGSEKQTKMLVEETFQEMHERMLSISPSYTGIKCNDGIEKLNISAAGFVGGASCGNTSLGNIWDEHFSFISEPQVCKMKACINTEDQKITKFP